MTRAPLDPAAAAADATRIREIAQTYARLTGPLERQRVNVLTASANVITQLPTDQLKEFAGRSAEVCGRLKQLLDSLDDTGRALTEYGEALERASASPNHDDADVPAEDPAQAPGVGEPRSLQSGSETDAPRVLPLDPIKAHLVATEAAAAQPADVHESAVAHETDFLRTRALEVLKAQIDHWQPEGGDQPYEQVRRAVPDAIARLQSPPPIEGVRDEVIPVRLQSDGEPATPWMN
ncbi:hypothetical protein [Yimella sp. cx-51]|uniref:hypothetical protein n=1 Tax=Yimella sp. cx-51 TaxID=2770551 RepID=UPI00165E676A|nr:hypothetical protein [Yimella sp. cx-51]MBC9958222.1 hypothetical protein [Yimella sp. cx-51]MBD2758920.1 hypothetical protein [Yimella sp. cx-573]QTH38745.1 hypothetical protein J5M86_03650 [Yimella sp. cx-51]